MWAILEVKKINPYCDAMMEFIAKKTQDIKERDRYTDILVQDFYEILQTDTERKWAIHGRTGCIDIILIISIQRVISSIDVTVPHTHWVSQGQRGCYDVQPTG